MDVPMLLMGFSAFLFILAALGAVADSYEHRDARRRNRR